jgi:hypothetical protein
LAATNSCVFPLGVADGVVRGESLTDRDEQLLLSLTSSSGAPIDRRFRSASACLALGEIGKHPSSRFPRANALLRIGRPLNDSRTGVCVLAPPFQAQTIGVAARLPKGVTHPPTLGLLTPIASARRTKVSLCPTAR